jgi:DNA-binding NarL/FixJ family response regulator
LAQVGSPAALCGRLRTVAIRLALIEDHAALREGLELLLAKSGCDVIGSADGEQSGFELVESTDPEVVVVDVTLADGDGISLTRRLLETRPERGIVIYTGSSEEEHLLDGLDSGARGYALKEGSIGELVEAIRVVAGGGSYVDPRLAPSLLSPKATQRQPSLSGREREIMSLLAEGLTGEEVADRLFLSAETVKTHVRNAMSKLEARNRVHAIAIALRQGEIDLPDEQGAKT